MDAVCKYVDSDDDDIDIAPLEQEAGLYVGKLQPLQGSSVPYFYGLFKASYTTFSRRKREIACIMLEYVCSDRKWELWDGPLEARFVFLLCQSMPDQLYVTVGNTLRRR